MANRKHLLIFSFLAVAILVLSTLVQSSNASSSSHDRVLLARQRNAARSQIPSCSEMVSRSQCSHNPNCKWCNSEVLDDMCFSTAEAWSVLLNRNEALQLQDQCFCHMLIFLISCSPGNGVSGYATAIIHCDQEAKLLQDNPGRDAYAEQQSSGNPRPCSLLSHKMLNLALNNK
ncbi:hypothetical protein SADUNF_Sadunf04G0042700 [Salix dunnii]|uniref:Uncharacterized protein n=1 Tax=Salix dunnii TaxID=1413687 RepID=A0A835KAG3_9ROSI|nr:hypothetical protein SADUNF_Sadunf04G0042700 [Salix dunnii]